MQINHLLGNHEKKLLGPLHIIPNIFFDSRGYFLESWNKEKFNKITSQNISFVQDNQSMSSRGVLRGLHYQLDPFGQGKLISAIKGSIYDVIVDLRRNSSTFMHWTGLEINDKIKNQLWIPVGFAHGFLTLSEKAIIQYKVTSFWSKEHERTLLWNDSDIGIKWPSKNFKNMNFLISDKDQNGKSFANLKKTFCLF
jgi:dTDP-4-dehydrorhamnose 3,5-epimerase